MSSPSAPARGTASRRAVTEASGRGGNNSKSQLCDGTTANRHVPARLALLPPTAKIVQVSAGGHATLMKAADGALYACGDNQFGQLGVGKALMIPQPTLVPGASVQSSVLFAGYNSAFSSDGCAVRMAGLAQSGILGADSTGTQPTFLPRAGGSLCAPPHAAPVADVVRVWPRGGASNCWAPPIHQNAVLSPQWALLRQTMRSAEAILKRNDAFLAAPDPVRMRSTLTAGPIAASGGGLIVKSVPERKPDGTRIWTGECDVIPQIDRIGGPIGFVSMVFNPDPRGHFISHTGDAPKLTGHVAGYPVYNGWMVMTKANRLPWIPQTLEDKLNAEGAKRDAALADFKRRTFAAAGIAEALEKQVSDHRRYRASFTSEQLKAPAVWGDPTGEGKRQLDARVAALRRLSPDEQGQVDELGRENRELERQATAATRAKSFDEAARLRGQGAEIAVKIRAIRAAREEKASPLILEEMAQYALTNLRPGDADRAMSVKADPAFPETGDPNRVQVIAIQFSFGGDPRNVDARSAQLRAWGQRAQDAFDFAALAALIR